MSLTRVCKKPAGWIQPTTRWIEGQIAPKAPRDPRDIRVVANVKAGVLAVIIPSPLSILHRMIAMSIGSEANRYSEHLTDLWKLGEIWGAPEYIEIMEALVNPPVPHHSVLRIA